MAANAGYAVVDCPLHSSHTPSVGLFATGQIMIEPRGIPLLLPWEGSTSFPQSQYIDKLVRDSIQQHSHHRLQAHNDCLLHPFAETTLKTYTLTFQSQLESVNIHNHYQPR